MPSRRRILYAEDDTNLALIISGLLERSGHAVQWVTDAEQAYSRLRAEPDAFDLVLTDLNMGGLNGLEFVRRARSLPYAGRIVVLSGCLEEEILSDAQAAGADRVLSKPLGMGDLLQALDDVFRQPPAPQAP